MRNTREPPSWEPGRTDDVQRSNDVLVRAGHDDNDKAVQKHTIEETLASDPQLAVGLLVVRSKLLQDQMLARGDN